MRLYNPVGILTTRPTIQQAKHARGRATGRSADTDKSLRHAISSKHGVGSLNYFRFFPALIVLTVLLALTEAQGKAQQNIYERDPFFGKNQFPQYRNISGLAGGGYGTDAQGHFSQSGPTAFSTPTAYTLGHDQVYLGIGGINFRGVPSLDTHRLNSSGVVTYGHTFGQVNIAFTDFLKSASLDSAINLQASLVPLRRNRLGVSLGVQDLLGLGGSAGIGMPTDRYSSQSVFFAFTYPLSTGGSTPLYLSGGLGTHRYNKGFGSLSYQLGGPVRTWLEYDGFGLNEGLLLTQRVGRGRGSFALNGNVGLVRGKYFLFGGGISF